MQYLIFVKHSIENSTITISIVLQHLVKKFQKTFTHLFIYLFIYHEFCFRIILFFIRTSWFHYRFDFFCVIVFSKQSFTISIFNIFTNCMRNSRIIVDIVHDFYKFNKFKKFMSSKIVKFEMMTLRKLSKNLLKACKNNCNSYNKNNKSNKFACSNNNKNKNKSKSKMMKFFEQNKLVWFNNKSTKKSKKFA